MKAVFEAQTEEERFIVSLCLPTNFSTIEWGGIIQSPLWPCAVALRVAEKKDNRYVCSSSYYYPSNMECESPHQSSQKVGSRGVRSHSDFSQRYPMIGRTMPIIGILAYLPPILMHMH
eukprot:scaffold10156_cov98-Skeletonema_dohrnii-CCMP3373.AAC.5